MLFLDTKSSFSYTDEDALYNLEFGGDCQGNKTYDYFADCGEHCKKYPKMCSSEKILRCGCKKGYIQIDLTYLSPCVKPEDCPKKSEALKEEKIKEKMEKHG
ncbi:uncharacterized protein TNCT_7171 [Trichonephila clavata]|uniref:Uncharacterized protein n=1 Tax=Trichonephila clavata TaxID=2740835 RepID=A0A8X6GJI3_TRICU|nr:uncharacterized protein TNCT_7171 [Trichonephila clavata]